KARRSDPKTILVIGDTGCRIKGAEAQDCGAAGWPFNAIAKKGAALDPDLIIHVGDYHYRESQCPDPTKCEASPHGDNWEVWQKDFFEPAAPLLARAPWIMVRGNHEGWTRAGAGWRILLSPQSRSAVDEPWPEESPPYSVRFGGLTMTILDVANADDAQTADMRRKKYEKWIADLAAAPADGPRWLLLHIPPWVSHKCPAAPCTERLDDRPLAAIRRLLRDPPSRIDLMLAGDTHMFQVFVPDTAAAPPQIIAAMSRTLP